MPFRYQRSNLLIVNQIGNLGSLKRVNITPFKFVKHKITERAVMGSIIVVVYMLFGFRTTVELHLRMLMIDMQNLRDNCLDKYDQKYNCPTFPLRDTASPQVDTNLQQR